MTHILAQDEQYTFDKNDISATIPFTQSGDLIDYTAMSSYAVHNLGGVTDIMSMPLSAYEAISATADVETLYVITED